MKNRSIIAIILLILLSTINPQENLIFSKFNLKVINIENNYIVKKQDIKKLLLPLYGKNLIFLNNEEIEKALMRNSFIGSFNIKKKYPFTLNVKIFEKKPIAILFDKKKKFYLSEKIDLIEYKKLSSYKNLPYVFGNLDEFKLLYINLKKIDFPLYQVKKFVLYESNRWDLETVDNKILKLPKTNYIESIQNYLDLKKHNDFEKYKVFDYRINNQLILK